MYNTTNKKDLFYIIVLILTLITVIVGATFALYALIHSQEEGKSAVYTGNLKIEYLSGKIINSNLLYPREEPSFETEKNVYKNRFKATNKGSVDSTLTISILINNNDFSEDTLMYSLYNEEEEKIFDGLIEGQGLTQIASNIKLKNNTSCEFTLIIWIKDNGRDQNGEMKKRLTGLIQLDANQTRK